MRCLVTGSKGLLGTELGEWLRGKGEDVHGWDLPGHDVTDIEKTINDIHRVKPDVIFHLAAWTDVDGCEKNQGKATTVNFQGTWAVALGAEELQCKLVHVSTDYVFDGKKKRPYRENDRTEPLSMYGRSKLMGEQAVTRSCKRHFIVRTGWLYGRGGGNFVDTIRKKAGKQDRLEVVEDQVGSPTWAADLCGPLHELGASDRFGTYHVTNSGKCSWAELARAVVELAGADCEVAGISTEQAARAAPRPAYSVLENRNFKRRFGHVPRPWQEALKTYLA